MLGSAQRLTMKFIKPCVKQPKTELTSTKPVFIA